MVATVVSFSDTEVTVQVSVRLGRSMLDNEVAIQQSLNEAGMAVTQKALEAFDADGAPIQVGRVRMTSRGRIPKSYQTPYGEVTVARHLYQPGGGGRTYCPLDHDARIVIASTPHFARMLSCKYAEMSGVRRVLLDLEQNHGRRLSLGVVQDVADAVATVALTKEEAWTYEPADVPAPVAAVSLGVDGTCALLLQDGWREVMLGTVALYDGDGARMHTT